MATIQTPTVPGSFQDQQPVFPIPDALFWLGPDRHVRLLWTRQVCSEPYTPSKVLPGVHMMAVHHKGEDQAGILYPENISLISQDQSFRIGRALMIILPNVTIIFLILVCTYLFIGRKQKMLLVFSLFQHLKICIWQDENNFCSTFFSVIRSISLSGILRINTEDNTESAFSSLLNTVWLSRKINASYLLLQGNRQPSKTSLASSYVSSTIWPGFILQSTYNTFKN